jgi:hypothetical protein
MATRSQQKNWETNKAGTGHCYLIEDRGKYVFVLYDKYVPPTATPVVSGKRDNMESAMDAARSAAEKHQFNIGSWSNLTSTM